MPTKPAFTRGPWTVKPEEYPECGGYQQPYIWAENGLPHAGVTICEIRIGIEGSDANANLIAAAPDLFAACKEALAELHARYLYQRHNTIPPADRIAELEIGFEALPTVIQLRAALAKAEGR